MAEDPVADAEVGVTESTSRHSGDQQRLGGADGDLTGPWSLPAMAGRARLWVAWIGPGRLAGAFGAALVLAGVGWWLLRSPTLPTEAALPAVSHSTSVPSAPSGFPASSTTGPSRPSLSEPAAAVIVHVTGAVLRPGVYEMAAGQRVDDALAAAGGPTPAADANSLNLAAPVADGDRIEVPALGQTSSAVAGATGSGHTHATSGTALSISSPVDLNHAGAAELEGLPGIGPATAAAIIDYRTQNGPFATIEQLLEVPGIGPAKLDAVREFVTA